MDINTESIYTHYQVSIDKSHQKLIAFLSVLNLKVLIFMLKWVFWYFLCFWKKKSWEGHLVVIEKSWRRELGVLKKTGYWFSISRNMAMVVGVHFLSLQVSSSSSLMLASGLFFFHVSKACFTSVSVDLRLKHLINWVFSSGWMEMSTLVPLLMLC